ncbi:MAG TPA: M56 family metallopeptidase [Candidatus Fournierella merdipullorum]|uniref:M56 family metallopeptidase n=1 Tax=Candidatus Allofournierella merdipullorum TaxID=2838595 RepID=A0A9D2E661_9FIRM|nr:M56 family metallopeptidase [Candidatus Fournierella merdipullorum]
MAEWLANVFIEFVNRSIAASWLVLAVLVLRLLLRKGPRWASVLLWGLVAFRLVCPFTLESALSLLPSRETVPDNIMLSPAPALNSGMAAVDQVVNPIVTESFAPAPGASANPLQVLIPLMALVWAAGIFVLCLYTLVSWLRLRRRVAEAVPVRDNIFESERVPTPFVFGIARPRIYLPAALPEAARGPVIAHEEAHIARRDHWWKPLGFALLAFYWFNPLMWAAYILFCRDIELACDERVVRDMAPGQRADYSQALLECSADRRALGACPLAFGEVGVKARVKAALHYKKPAFWAVAGALVLCAVMAVVFLTDPLTPRYDFSENAIVSATVWDYAEPSERELNTSQLDELTGRLEGLQGLSRTSEEGFTPLYALVAELEDGTSLTFNGYSDDGSQVRTEYKGRLWQVTDEAFCAYLYNQWQEGDTAEAIPEPGPLDEYADALIDTLELKDDQILFTLPEEVPEGAQLTIQISGRAVYEDGFSQSLHFLEDTDWTPGEQYSIPYDPAYTLLSMFLYADYPDGTQEEHIISLNRLIEALVYAQSAPALTPEVADKFIADTLASFTMSANGRYNIILPDPVPLSENGKTTFSMTLNATYSDGPGTYSTESHEFGPEYGGAILGGFSGDMDTLVSVSLNAFFMTDEGENQQSIYARGGIELNAPFTFGEPAGYSEPTATVYEEGGATKVLYTFSDGSEALVSMVLPTGFTVQGDTTIDEAGIPVLGLLQNGQQVGAIHLCGLGATDEPTLATVDTAADSVPMQIFANMALSNHAGFEDYHVVQSSDTGAVATARYVWQELGTTDAAVTDPWNSRDCVLAYDWQVLPYFAEFAFSDGALSAQQLSALAESIELSIG